MPKSYLPDEPGARRALEHAFDPFDQVAARLEALQAIGHPTDKVELLVDIPDQFHGAKVDAHTNGERGGRRRLLVQDRLAELHCYKEGIFRVSEESDGGAVARIQNDAIIDRNVFDDF